MAAHTFVAQVDNRPVRVRVGGFSFSTAGKATLFQAEEVAAVARLLSLMYPGDRVSFRVSTRTF